MNTSISTLMKKGILKPSGEINKDKINFVAGAITQPFAEMVWVTTGGDMDTINRLKDILITMNTPADRGKLFKLIQMLYGFFDLRFSDYQLKGDEETRDYRFEPLDRLQARRLAVNMDNYELVYSALLHDINTPGDIYRKFNQDHPADFTGHSLYVFDVVVLKHGDRQTARYCDSYGFTKMPQFLQE